MTKKQIATRTSALALAALCSLGAAGLAAASEDRGEYRAGYRYAENDRGHDRDEYRRNEYRGAAKYDDDDRDGDRYEHRRGEDQDDGRKERGEHR